MCSLRDAAKELEAAGAKVFGVSLDDVSSQAEFVKQQELNFPLLSDPDGSLAARLDVMYADKPYTKRITLIIDPRGVIRSRDESVDVKAHGTDVVERLKALKAR